MAHIRTQIRDTLKAYLREKLGHEHVFSAARAGRGFQKDNLPLVLVAIREDIETPISDNDFGSKIVNRHITGVLTVMESTAFEDVEDRVDAKCAELEVLLCNPAALGFTGKVSNWSVGGASDPQIDEIGEGLRAWSVQMPVNFTIRTTDGNPEQNIFK